jgi:hypothetical protein
MWPGKIYGKKGEPEICLAWSIATKGFDVGSIGILLPGKSKLTPSKGEIRFYPWPRVKKAKP